MNVLSLDSVGKTLVDAPLFERVTLGIDAGEKIGFIGKNGAGKSTFLKILTGEILPDSGSVARNRGLTMSTLPQRPVHLPEDLTFRVLLPGRCRPRTPAGRGARCRGGSVPVPVP